MRHILRLAVASLLVTLGGTTVMAIEEAGYVVVARDARFELRDYAPQLLAETVVTGSMEDAGNKAFRTLFRYISGGNRSQTKVEMTAPVSQQTAGERISMTAPVGQQRAGDGWVVSFMMPAGYTLETLPLPEDASVTLRPVPARRMAAVRYSGFWSRENYLRHERRLLEWIGKHGLRVTGDPVWARYNPPFTPWFLRRNEILVPVAAESAPSPAPAPPAPGDPAPAAGAAPSGSAGHE